MKDIREIKTSEDIENNISTMTLITTFESKIELQKLFDHLNFNPSDKVFISMPQNKKSGETTRTFKNQVPLFTPFQERNPKTGAFTVRNVKTKVFNNGRLHITGCKNTTMMKSIIDIVADLIEQSHSHIQPLQIGRAKHENIEIVMMNTTICSGFEINQEKFKDILIKDFDMYASFKPKIYAGIIAKFEVENQVVASFLIFKSGKIIVAGAKQFPMLEKAIHKMTNILLSRRQDIEL